MNFLAHAFLSGDNIHLLLGNFVADSIKGKVPGDYPSDFQKGVLLHHAIDRFTDLHPDVHACTTRLQPHFRKFAGVVNDIYFDHFLARNWNHYSDIPLKVFTGHVYNLLHENETWLPTRSRRILPWMVSQDWLTGYADFDALHRVFLGMSRRTRFESGMERAVEVLQSDYEYLEGRFKQFFPQLQQYSAEVLLQQH